LIPVWSSPACCGGIVSSDPDLLNLKAYHGIPIVDPAEALKRLPQRA